MTENKPPETPFAKAVRREAKKRAIAAVQVLETQLNQMQGAGAKMDPLLIRTALETKKSDVLQEFKAGAEFARSCLEKRRTGELTMMERLAKIAELEIHYDMSSEEFVKGIEKDMYTVTDSRASEWLVLLDRGDLV